MMIRKKIVLLGIMLLLTNVAEAADCQEIPSCASLGFGMSLERCSGADVLRCPFDKTNDNAVWCHKKNIRLRCLQGNYFNNQTGQCYPKNVSDYVFVDDEEDLKAIVLQVSAIKVIQGKTYDEIIEAENVENLLPLRHFHKVEDYLFKNFGSGCYIVADDSVDKGLIVYINSERLGVKVDADSFQKYCFLVDKDGSSTAKAALLRYQLLDYRW